MYHNSYKFQFGETVKGVRFAAFYAYADMREVLCIYKKMP